MRLLLQRSSLRFSKPQYDQGHDRGYAQPYGHGHQYGHSKRKKSFLQELFD